MKKSILAVTLLAISMNASAWRMLHTEPELLISAGGSVGDADKSLSIKFTVQETLCYTAKYLCFNPSVMWLVTESDDPDVIDFSDKINIGAGLDLKYKIPKMSNNAFYIEAGPYVFVKRLTNHGEQKVNAHIGTGVEYRRFTLSVDAYGRSDPLYMLNVGYRF